MVKIKRIRMENYCGYEDMAFDFTQNGSIKNFCAFYGPNGIGKSTVLSAINFLSMAKRINKFNTETMFRKLIFNRDYNPAYAAFDKPKEILFLHGVFDEDGEEKKVVLSSKDGVIINELSDNPWGSIYYIDVDKPISVNSFQLQCGMKDKFLDMAEVILGYKCELRDEVNALGEMVDSTKSEDYVTDELFYTNFVLYKEYSDVKVHFKRMSAGEKKIATLLRNLCNPEQMANSDIILIDNIEMHVYFKRHLNMINKIKEVFSDKQFLVTTHSGILVDKLPSNELYDIEEYKKRELTRKQSMIGV
jgi:AAA15 family ATPase/GTPase